MNYIAIDPSLISTALVVNGKIFNYCREDDACGKTGLNKWYKLCEQYINYKWINYRKFDNYSEGELIKLKDYDLITDNIIKDILDNIDTSIPTKVGIEGYSFSSDPNSIIDLVTFSTLLRKKLFDLVTEDILVLSPSSLKQLACKLTYKPIDIGKKKPKLEWRNNYGISGGKFTKTEMFLSIVENDEVKDNWFTICKQIKDDVLSNKSIKKPLEDTNDAVLLYYILKNQII
jgi:hypothetical protein